jgi:hypothetical protein
MCFTLPHEIWKGGIANLVLEPSLRACSFGWWLMAGADLLGEKSTVGWLLVAGLF